MRYQQFRGTGVALITPFSADTTIDWESLERCIEHVINVLSRLNDLPIPDQVETNLKLTEEPLADTARYDSLHNQEVTHV